ncbi:MAG: hypothetical protein HYR51_19945 [Candidatus Rokubacteria bacterium]|nr:hypothetical protein [Candidatus Rokubacteria bacterium]
MIPGAVSRLLALVGGARGPFTMVIAAEPDAVLLASSAALRRLGARITRYDVEEGTLEARQDGAMLRLTAVADGSGGSQLAIESDAPDGRRLVKRFRAELSRPAPQESA